MELDREVNPIITLRVIARDHLAAPMSYQRFGEALVHIHLEDINDHSPVFIDQPYHATFCVKEAVLPPYRDQAKLTENASPHVLSELRQACQSNYFKVSQRRLINAKWKR